MKVKGHKQCTVHTGRMEVQYLFSMIMKATPVECSYLQEIQVLVFQTSQCAANSNYAIIYLC